MAAQQHPASTGILVSDAVAGIDEEVVAAERLDGGSGADSDR